MNAKAPIALSIQQSWNGKALSAYESVYLELEFRAKGLLLDFEAPFYNDPPPHLPAGSTPKLWEHEVVEFFLAHGDDYTEIELGPYGHYLVLQLKGYRNPIHTLSPIRYKAYLCRNRWMGTALIPWNFLPPAPWTYNAYAIHGQGASRRYLAAYPVPGDAPDFHQLRHFQPLQAEPAQL